MDQAVERIIEARARPVGNFQVARMLPVMQRRHLGPWVFVDHMGPVSFPPGDGLDVPPHPHIGLSTVTYLFEGEALHRDSLGSVQLITPGAINLMTAGKGIVHSERTRPERRAAGGTMHGAQLWLGLPLAHEEGEPRFEHFSAGSLPEIAREGLRARVLLGELLGARSPIAHPANPLFVDLQLEPGATLALDAAPEGHERALVVIEGAVAVLGGAGPLASGGEPAREPAGGDSSHENQMLVLKSSVPVELRAEKHSRLLLLGGPPLVGAERFIDWNFVSSSKARIAQAKQDWIERRFPLVPGDELERIELHRDHG